MSCTKKLRIFSLFDKLLLDSAFSLSILAIFFFKSFLDIESELSIRSWIFSFKNCYLMIYILIEFNGFLISCDTNALIIARNYFSPDALLYKICAETSIIWINSWPVIVDSYYCLFICTYLCITSLFFLLSWLFLLSLL